MPRMRKECFACEKKGPEKHFSVSYHKFPTDDAIRKAWIEFCQHFFPLRSEDDTSRLVLCSIHFKKECFTFINNSGLLGKTRHYLRKGAVPTILYGKNGGSIEFIDVKQENPADQLDLDNLGLTLEVQPSNTQIQQSEPTEPSSSKASEEVEPSNTENQQSAPSLFIAPDSEDYRIRVEPRCKRKRYPGDFSLEDMSSPERARQYFIASKTELEKYNRIIKSLRQQERRLTRKLRMLKGSARESGKGNKYLTRMVKEFVEEEEEDETEESETLCVMIEK